MEARKLFIRLRVEVAIGCAPRAIKVDMVEIAALDNVLEAVAQKEVLHVVKMRFTTVDKLGVIAACAKETRHCEEVLLGFTQFHHRWGWCGWKTSHNRFNTAH